jgi:hypothetical protein
MLAQADAERIRQSLFCLSRAPLPYRKLNRTLPGHVYNTLYKADRYIRAQLAS